jgi:hypothetical protein
MLMVDSFGGSKPSSDDDRAWMTLSPEASAGALGAGLLVECKEHGAIEIAEGVTPADFEAGVGERQTA